MMEGHRLDPADWDAFSEALEDAARACADRLRHARDLPWQPPPPDMADRVALDEVAAGDPGVIDAILRDIVPYSTGNTHPRFFGWVHGTGTPLGVAAEMIAAAMNANMGGRDQGGAHVERAVLSWLHRVAGWPPDASGLLTTGTSQATILALSCARMRAFPKVREQGIGALPPLRVYAAEGAHSCVKKALEVMGHGSVALRGISAPGGRMDVDALSQAIAEDRAEGWSPLAVVGTVGSVNLGTFDDLSALADLCAAEDLWLHADAAFGFWTRLADLPWRDLSVGIERADSLATDFHKWMSVPYDCGAVLIRDHDLHLSTFRERPAYLSEGQALAGGEWWATDYGFDLSRGFRALKVWATIRGLGTDALGAQITDNCRQAAYMGELAEASDVLDLAAPVVSNLCVIRPRRGEAAAIAAELQLSGDAVFSTTLVDGVSCLRAAIVNHRTTRADVERAVRAVEQVIRSA
ncbi:pyridoxal phosphate-dependent decarboxylase family protein [Jannaschia aquimarina]|uniref:Ddc_1 protein n=1 Tax=Jannaschia aquimarina TaxID=935700 RepID=A0A0D1CTB0_9RHOB|nr:pyridoxal-dependent decarboxylase [Jannaschia aquimarina]KIT18007.1 L-2,4-diaminobutyrate decarboxylase [Jannaschia aquimarina]SNS88407.1 Glutamate or tyrosine decarboxylase [Jannaschia aquimarina]